MNLISPTGERLPRVLLLHADFAWCSVGGSDKFYGSFAAIAFDSLQDCNLPIFSDRPHYIAWNGYGRRQELEQSLPITERYHTLTSMGDPFKRCESAAFSLISMRKSAKFTVAGTKAIYYGACKSDHDLQFQKKVDRDYEWANAFTPFHNYRYLYAEMLSTIKEDLGKDFEYRLTLNDIVSYCARKVRHDESTIAPYLEETKTTPSVTVTTANMPDRKFTRRRAISFD